MIRITGGEHRGRLLQTPAGTRTRPTQARLRQALFNSVQAHVPEARVLDLFAGSGALALEALSRGASHAVLVENARAALKLIEKNAAALGVKERVDVLALDVGPASTVARLEELGPFQLVLADPPYGYGWELKLLSGLPWDRLLLPGGLFCLEWGGDDGVSLPEEAPFLVKAREKNYGDSVLTTYARPE